MCGPQVLRADKGLLCQARGHDPHVVRARFLRHTGGAPVVGAVQTSPLARHPGSLRQRRHPRCGKSPAFQPIGQPVDV